MQNKKVSTVFLALMLVSMLANSSSALLGQTLETTPRTLPEYVDSSASVFSVPPAASWNKTYGGANSEYGRSMVQTIDGGYATTGETYSFGAGGTDYWLVKSDTNGTMQWNKTYGGTNSDVSYSVIQTNDGGYALAGYTYSFGAGSGDFWLVKTDPFGEMLWNKTYGGPSDDYAFSVVQASDGGYAVAGVTWSYGINGDFWLVKTDASGNMQWNKTFGWSGNDYCYCLVQTIDGGYALGGHTYSLGPSADFLLIKTNSAGGLEWNRTYGDASSNVMHSLIQTMDGGYAALGYTSSISMSTDFWLVKTDPNGNALWNKTYGGSSGETGYSVFQTNDGGYALAGYTGSYGAGASDFWLVKTDSVGNAEWNATYGGLSSDLAYTVIQTDDEGYAIAGETSSFGAGNTDMWLVKVDTPPETEITIFYLETTKMAVGAGYPVTITTVVENDGETTPTFNLTTYCNSAPIRTDTMAPVPGSNATVKFSWTPSSSDRGDYRIWASTTGSDQLVPNLCIGHRAFVSIPGDINTDAKVDGKDISKAAYSFGAYGPDFLFPGSPPHPRWNSEADVNADNVINGKDLVLAAKNFGKFWIVPQNNISISATDPHVADGIDTSAVNVTVRDQVGSPVLGANVVVVADAGRDWKWIYPTQEIGNGTYVTSVSATSSGNYTLSGYDSFGNNNKTLVTYLDGSTSCLELEAAYDPSGSEPSATLDAYATDAYGNAVENANITFTTNLGTINTINVSLGVFTALLTSNDWGIATVTAVDIESGVFSRITVEFSAVSLQPLAYPPLGENTTVAVRVYAPSIHGYLDSYMLKIYFNNTATPLLGVTDGDPADGFPAPNVTVIDSNTIAIYQDNQLTAAGENVWVANLTLNAAILGQFTIGFLPPEAYLSITYLGIPKIFHRPVPATITVKTGVETEIKIKVWRLIGPDGKTPIVTDEQIQHEVDVMQANFDDMWKECTLKCFIVKFVIEINNISWTDWQAIDKNKNGKLDEGEEQGLFGGFNRANVAVNVYKGFPLPGATESGQSWTGGKGGGWYRGGVIIDETKDHDGYTLKHEVVHYLSRNEILDSQMKGAKKQGAKKPGNLFNNKGWCNPATYKGGHKVSKEQGKKLTDKLYKKLGA